jgi:hypothetical protein
LRLNTPLRTLPFNVLFPPLDYMLLVDGAVEELVLESSAHKLHLVV